MDLYGLNKHFSGFTVLTQVNNRILSGESFQNNLSAGAGNKKKMFFLLV